MPEDQKPYEEFMDTDLDKLKIMSTNISDSERHASNTLNAIKEKGFAIREALFRRETKVTEGCAVLSTRRPYEGQKMRVTEILRTRPITVRGLLFKKDGTVGKKVADMRFFEKCEAPEIIEEEA